MIGYHYTTRKNWEKIQRTGLVPYYVSSIDRKGIWLWEKRAKGKNHVGNVLRVLAVHNTVEVCLLKAEFPKEECFSYSYAGKTTFVHEGSFQNFIYHKRFPAQIALRTIPPEKIQLVAQYNLRELLCT